jgi:hypothetical protein
MPILIGLIPNYFYIYIIVDLIREIVELISNFY